ncbi:SCO family protein [Halorussus litoreus]|uniref:SCO family protein n=1 Tax=Halorussus litoreus TaxID=1710536 RepID=UPI000E2526AD|nr:SCO family protein [Halorussus litoreus]
MDRRRYLAALSGIGATAGCLGVNVGPFGGDGSANAYLDEPDREVDGSALPYPTYGDELPEVTVADPVAGRDVTTTAFDDREVLMTFFYSHCNTVCPFLISSLRSVKTAAVEGGYGDELAVLAVTFDPERDTADRLREYAETMNVDLDADNWFFLRPETEDRAKSVVQETFGVAFEKTGATDSSMYMFNHLGLVVLVNRDGYVERAYSGDDPKADRIQRDLETVRTRVA